MTDTNMNTPLGTIPTEPVVYTSNEVTTTIGGEDFAPSTPLPGVDRPVMPLTSPSREALALAANITSAPTRKAISLGGQEWECAPEIPAFAYMDYLDALGALGDIRTTTDAERMSPQNQAKLLLLTRAFLAGVIVEWDALVARGRDKHNPIGLQAFMSAIGDVMSLYGDGTEPGK